MRIPARYEQLGITSSDSGVVSSWPTPQLYLPPGFVPIGDFELGNGDTFGLYWPIGMEETEPILCEFWHDEWTVHPFSSSYEGLLRFMAASGRGRDEGLNEERLVEAARALGVALPDALPDGEELTGVQHVVLDRDSPEACLRAAKELAGSGDLDAAEAHLRNALRVLPEYTPARLAFAQLRRRRGDRAGCAEALAFALGSPSCFGGDRKRALQDAVRVRDEDAPALRKDPIWSRRGLFRFVDGVKESDDYRLLEEAVEEFLARSEGQRAVWARVLHGERMAAETVSFRERYGFTREAHFTKLRAELMRAGFVSRIAALGN